MPISKPDSSPVDILVVDDRPEAILALESILARPEYTIVSANSGAEALRRVLDRDFAVILLDVLMPDMDGFEVASIIKQRERSRHTPIIFLTAAGPDLGFIYRGYSVGAVDYMIKPLDADVLRAKVSIFVDLFRKDRHIKEQAEALRLNERRERELELAEIRLAGEHRYRNLAEAIPQIVWTADPSGAITYSNQRWYEYTGQSADAGDRTGWLGAIHDEDRARCRDAWDRALESQDPLEIECRLLGRDGSYRWYLCRAVPERGLAAVVGWLGTCTDFDDRKRALDSARAAVHARDEFLSIASHELRTPLSTLQLRLQSIATSMEANSATIDERWPTRLATAMRQCDRLQALIDNLLDVSRITSGQLTLQRETFDLCESVRTVVDTFAEVAERAGCRIELRLDGPTVGVWDRLRVEQILQNLLGNAVKYAPASAVEISLQTSEASASLSVRDHGMGIAAEDLERIFGQFQRAASARHYGGLGMGLYIARQIAVAHGGTIHVASQPGEGSTFTVELPLAAAATEPLARRAEA